ncbi:MAG TPA: hypothetical protein EYQ74_11200 [Planctomycetes bacterium]|nr:hypothetical protein [Planctomycetota bacterium]
MLNSFKNTFLLALGALALTAPSVGQIPLQPDNLWSGGFYSNPLCSNAPLSLPTFPGFKQVSMEIGWQDCQLGSQKAVDAQWSAPVSPTGASTQEMTSTLRLTETLVGNLIAEGKMTLTYSRTWYEVQDFATQEDLQVWRFLVNGDLRYTLGTKGSLRPSCAFSKASQKNRVRYSGYVDWALDLQSGTWSSAWMLTHATDTFEHAAGHPRAGSFHCKDSYSFVGPANGFQPNPVLPAENGCQNPFLDRSVVRRVRRPRLGPPPFPPVLSAPYPASKFEEDVFFCVGNQYEHCPCATSTSGSSQFAIAHMTITGNFGSAAQSNNQMVSELVSMAIGSWTNQSVYPGVEDLRWTIAEYDYYDPCANETRKEIFHGVTTRGGYEAWGINYDPNYVPNLEIWEDWNGSWNPPFFNFEMVRLGSVLIDQSNALRKGRTSMNLPFKSDHILNLNY